MEIVNNSGKQIPIPSGGTVEAVVEKREDGFYGRLRIRSAERISYDEVEVGPFDDQFEALKESELMVTDFLDATSAEETNPEQVAEEAKSLKSDILESSRYEFFSPIGKFVFDSMLQFGVPKMLLQDIIDLDIDEHEGYCDMYFYPEVDIEEVLDCLEDCGVTIDEWDSVLDFPDFEGERVHSVCIDIEDFWG